MRTISLSCYNRTGDLRQTLKSLKEQKASLSDYKLYINCEPGNRKVSNIVKNIDFIETDIVINKTQLGINGNTFEAMDRAFSESDFNLYLEDDIRLSPDTLCLFEWYTKQDLTDIASLLLCNIWDNNKCPDRNLIYEIRSFCGWGFIVSKCQFEKYFKPVWFPEIGCWDYSSGKYVRTFKDIYHLAPQLSRSTNIGKIGTNMKTSTWEKFMGGHKFNTDRIRFDYYIGNGPS